MTGASKAYPWQLVLIDGWPVDCTRTEVHTFDSEVTEFPVESGSVISDNIRLLPIRVDVECVVSNSAFGEAALAQIPEPVFGPQPPTTFSPPDGALRSSVTYERLIAIRNRREPITIRTSRGKFESMWPKTIGIPRDNQTGDAIVFTVNFHKIEVVSNTRGKRVAIPIATGGKKTITKSVEEKNTGALSGPFARVGPAGGNYWFDPDINAWRSYWSLEKPLGGVGRSAYAKYNYFKGPMYDGFAGSDAAMKKHIIDTYGGPLNAVDSDAAVPPAIRRHQASMADASAKSLQSNAAQDAIASDPSIVAPTSNKIDTPFSPFLPGGGD